MTSPFLHSYVPFAQIRDSTITTGDISFYNIITASSSIVEVANCKFTKGAGPYLSLSNSLTNVVDSDFVNNLSFASEVVNVADGTVLTLERCSFRQNSAFSAPGAIYISPASGTTPASTLILKGDENRFVKNGNIGEVGTHILVGSGNVASGCESTTFIDPMQSEGVVDENGEPVAC
jgi:hypothetical protein